MRQILLFTAVAAVAGCAGSEKTCESIEEVRAQEQYCLELREKLNSTNRLQVRSVLTEQYQKECIDFRYYRDSFDDNSICTLDDKKRLAQQAKQ